MTRGIPIVAAGVLSAVLHLNAADWPHMHGPLGTGVSPEGGLARSWPADGPPVRWRVDLHPGYGGAAVADGDVFILDRDPNQNNILLCLDLETGEERWRYAWQAPGQPPFKGALSVPSVDAHTAFAIGPTGHFVAVDRATHRLRWWHHLEESFLTSAPPEATVVGPLAADARYDGPVALLRHVPGPEKWLIAGPLPAEPAPESLPFWCRDGGWLTTAEAETRFRPRELDIDEQGNVVLDLPSAAGKPADGLFVMYTVFSNAFEQVYDWYPGHPQARARLAGRDVQPGDRLWLRPGLYPLSVLVQVAARFPRAPKPTLGPLFWVAGTGPEHRGPKYGHSQSPLVLPDRVVVAPMMQEAGLVACNKRSGRTLWRTPALGGNPFSHASPVLAKLDGVRQIVCMGNDVYYQVGWNRKAIISGVAPGDGALLWQIPSWKFYNIPIPAALPVPGRRLFVAGGYRIGAFLLECRRQEGEWAVDYVFQKPDACAPQLHRAVLHREHLYIQSHDRYHGTTKDGLVCMDLDGNIRWRSGPADTFDAGGLLIADGLIYVMDGKTGVLCLVEATPDAYRPLSRAKILAAADGRAWAPPALSRGRLLVRDQRQLVCLDVRARPGTAPESLRPDAEEMRRKKE